MGVEERVLTGARVARTSPDGVRVSRPADEPRPLFMTFPFGIVKDFRPVFDKAVDRALGIADATARQKVMAGLETILRKEAVLIQPFWRTLTRHATPRLRGAAILPTLVHRHHEWWLAP